jgi:lantibiotic modifying enzyme
MSDESSCFLEAAARIGRSLCRSAYWDSERRHCNWVGRSALEVSAIDAPLVPTTVALGADLYSGAAGVCLFLAELYAIVGDDEARDAAIAGASNALRNAGRRLAEPAQPLGFYAGLLGTAFAGHRVAALAADPGLATCADALLDRVVAAATAPHVFDVIGGNAGAIPALLVLSRLVDRPGLRDLAHALGGELLQTAERRGAVYWWDPQMVVGPGDSSALLTGLAHGASGLGLSLLELHQDNGRGDVLDAARGAFTYEDTHFDALEGNWVDLRTAGATGSAAHPSDAPRRFSMAWCHGAPGIALARARASRIDPDPAQRAAHERVARTAVVTTVKGMNRALADRRADATLCHGLCGLCEISLTVAGWLNDCGIAETSASIARALLDRHSNPGDWPTGVSSGGPNPSLMLGTAGVGFHFLRQYYPRRIASPLWLMTTTE